MPDLPPSAGAPTGEAAASGTPLVPTLEPESVTIILDGHEVRARKGEMLIAAAERAGTYIPGFATTRA